MTCQIKLIDIQEGKSKQISGAYSYWHTPRFMAAVADLHGIKAFQLLVYKGDELFAILPLYERSRLGIKAIVAPVGAYYQGISFAYESNVSAPRKLLDTTAVCTQIGTFLASHYHRLHLRLNPENVDVRGFTWIGYKASPLYTFRSSLDASLPTLPDERKKLKSAQNLGMRLEERFDSDLFIRLQKDLDKRKKHRLGISYSGLQSFVEELFSEGLLKQFNVLWEDKPVSSNILLHDGGDVAYTLFQATEEGAMRKGAATFHSLALLQHLPAGTRIFDYCGANVQEVARFKAALGLELVNFYEIRL